MSVAGERGDACVAMVRAVVHGLGEGRMDSRLTVSDIAIITHRFRLVS